MALQLTLKGSESRLVQMAADVRSSPAGWVAVYFRLSRLLDEYKSDYQIKIAINLIHDLLKTHEGALFVLSDSSIIVLCYKLEQTLMEKLIFQLRYLYMDDPLCYNEQGHENPEFCTVYDVKRDAFEFESLCNSYMAIVARKAPLSQRIEAHDAPEAHESPKVMAPSPVTKPAEQRYYTEHLPPPVEKEEPMNDGKDSKELSASKLVAIERSIRVLDLHPVLRRQPVCAVLPDMKIRRVFDELYLHIAHLRRMMKSEVDFFSNRWLFKYLTTILDQRMIELIRSRPSHYLANPISINLNVETLLSTWFTTFDALIKPATKVGIVIELPVLDLFADMTGFKLAVREVQKLGYRVCLDGLSTETFLAIDREKFGLDLIKVQWNASMSTEIKSDENTALINAVQSTGSNRIILCRCDNRAALEYGMAIGISLFQGRYLDSLLNPTAKVEN